jgi:hypothetical protein
MGNEWGSTTTAFYNNLLAEKEKLEEELAPIKSELLGVKRGMVHNWVTNF